MPRENEPDAASTGKQSPEATKDSSPTPTSPCQAARDTTENRESSVDPTVQEMTDTSCDVVEEPKSTASDDSEESTCSKCGGSKNYSDKDATNLAPTQPICKCDPVLVESLQEEKLLKEKAEDVSESLASDTLSDDSICSKCGGTKRSKNYDLKPHQTLCKCHPKSPKKDEMQEEEVESSSLQEIPLVAVGTEDTSQIETFKGQNPDFEEKDSPPEDQPPKDGSNAEQNLRSTAENNQQSSSTSRSSPQEEGQDVSCTNCKWIPTLVIVSLVGTIVIIFATVLVLRLTGYI